MVAAAPRSILKDGQLGHEVAHGARFGVDLANALFGWWWADPAAALVIRGHRLPAGRDAWRGDQCSLLEHRIC